MRSPWARASQARHKLRGGIIERSRPAPGLLGFRLPESIMVDRCFLEMLGVTWLDLFLWKGLVRVDLPWEYDAWWAVQVWEIDRLACWGLYHLFRAVAWPILHLLNRHRFLTTREGYCVRFSDFRFWRGRPSA